MPTPAATRMRAGCALLLLSVSGVGGCSNVNIQYPLQEGGVSSVTARDMQFFAASRQRPSPYAFYVQKVCANGRERASSLSPLLLPLATASGDWALALWKTLEHFVGDLADDLLGLPGPQFRWEQRNAYVGVMVNPLPEARCWAADAREPAVCGRVRRVLSRLPPPLREEEEGVPAALRVAGRVLAELPKYNYQAGLVDGVNSKGLYVGMQLLKEYSKYPNATQALRAAPMGRALWAMELGNYILASFDNTSHVVSTFLDPEARPFVWHLGGLVPSAHWIVRDGTESVVLEWTCPDALRPASCAWAQVAVHREDVGAVTNAPPYLAQKVFMQQSAAAFGPGAPENPAPYRAGSTLLPGEAPDPPAALSGDGYGVAPVNGAANSPVARFQLLAYLARWAGARTAPEARSAALLAIGKTEVLPNTNLEPGNRSFASNWQSLVDHRARAYLLRPYAASNFAEFDVARVCDASGEFSVRPFYDNCGSVGARLGPLFRPPRGDDALGGTPEGGWFL